VKLIVLMKLNPFRLAKKVYGSVLRLFKLYILKDEFTVEVTRWFRDKGDETLRLDYPELNENSVVFDLGGYKGDFAKAINEKYRCRVYLFEPHPKFYKMCVDRFWANEKVIPLNYGLSDKDGVFILSDSVDGSSFLNPNHTNRQGIQCQVKEVFKTLNELNVSNIDLMKINIEGGEYPLLLHIASANEFPLVNQYQIQFHDFIDDAASMRDKIIDALSKTHKRSWCYTFVWENWRNK
jgi:FkbM family methyltransferase